MKALERRALWERARVSTQRVIGTVALTCTLVLSGCQEDLYTNLAERDANAMIATLERSGIYASRVIQEDGRMKVVVEHDRFAEAVTVLDEAGLPKQNYASMGEIFKQNGLVASPLQERAQMLYALSEELSRTISEIDGVLSARVHIVLPDNDPLRLEAQPSSASVFIRYESDLAIDPLIPQIKTLVANAIAGLDYSKVSVVPIAAPAKMPSATHDELVSIYGVTLLETSVPRAMWLFGSVAALAVLLSVAFAIFLWRQRGRGPYSLETPR